MQRRFSGLRALAIVLATAFALAACSARGAGAASSGISASPSTPAASEATSGPPSPSSVSPPSSEPAGSQAPDSGGVTGAGDIPDNAVFLTYQGGSPAFRIQYVEGWQVTPGPTGVVIRDKDSSETVELVGMPPDVAAYVTGTDLPRLRAQAGFQQIRREAVTVNNVSLIHLVYHLPAAPDPVTGKQVPSTVDRYYVPGQTQLAVVSLSTPDGVDNVDAFHQMIGSFRWR